MIRLYEESSEFDAYTKFDTNTGLLVAIDSHEFQNALHGIDIPKPVHGIVRIKTDAGEVFTGETPSTHTRFPRRIYFQITRKCNLHCPACFIRADQHGEHVPFDSISKLIPFLSENGLMEVRLSGGEPTIHPNFEDILNQFRDHNIYVSVGTNGVFGERIRRILSNQEHLWVIFSIDGNRETHNRYRGDTYDTIVHNIMMLKNANPQIRVRLTTILTKETLPQMFEMAQLCKQLDAESLTVIPLRPHVRDSKIVKQMVTSAELRQAIETLIQAKNSLRIKFSTTIETDYKSQIHSDPVFRKRSSCGAGREGLNLDYDAKRDEFLMYACSYSPASDLNALSSIRRPFLAGTFPRHNVSMFGEIWRDEKRWTLFRDLSLKSPKCLACDYLKRHVCTGSCPIQNIDYDSIVADMDVLTQLKEQINQNAEWYCYQNILDDNNETLL